MRCATMALRDSIQLVVRNDCLSCGISPRRCRVRAALEEVLPQTHHQCYWVHKGDNVPDNLPETTLAQAKDRLRQMYLSTTRQDALGAFENFLSLCVARYPKDSVREWKRTCCSSSRSPWPPTGDTSGPPNPIESTLSTVRHRTRQTKRMRL